MKKGSKVSIEIQQIQDMDAAKWHEVLSLRAAVFVVEQRCVYPDPDEQDHEALHLRLCMDGELVGYIGGRAW